MDHVKVGCSLWLELLSRYAGGYFFALFLHIFSLTRTCNFVRLVDFCRGQGIIIELSTSQRVKRLIRFFFDSRASQWNLLAKLLLLCCLEPPLLHIPELLFRILDLQLDVMPINHVTKSIVANFWVQ